MDRSKMVITPELYEQLSSLTVAYLDELGREVPNPKSIMKELGIARPPTLQEQIKRVLRTELSRQAQEQGFETFAEANDFDVPDEDPDPISPYVVNDMVEEVPVENKEEVTEDESEATVTTNTDAVQPDISEDVTTTG